MQFIRKVKDHINEYASELYTQFEIIIEKFASGKTNLSDEDQSNIFELYGMFLSKSNIGIEELQLKYMKNLSMFE